MSGYLHELGGNSGVYSYVSLPRLVETRKPLVSPDSTLLEPNPNSKHRNNIPNGSVPYLRKNIQNGSLHLKKITCQRVNANNEAYIKRRDKIKNRIASQRINISNYKPNVQDTKIPTSQVRNKRTTTSTKIVPTFEATQQRRSVPLKGAFKINEWTEKLLEEARDDLESHSVSIQTEHDDVDGAFKTETKDQSTQTDADAEEEDRKFNYLVSSLSCEAVKHSLFEILHEEIERVTV